MTSKNEIPPNLPPALQLLFGVSGGSLDRYGLYSLRGFYYQYLYVLPLFGELLDSKSFDTFDCESLQDFMAWRGNPDHLEHLLLVQVKSHSTHCFLRRAAEVSEVFNKLVESIKTIKDARPARLTCRIVYNRYHDCVKPGCKEQFLGSSTYSEFTSEVARILPSTDLFELVELRQFLPIPLTQQAFIEEVRFLDKLQPGIVDFLDKEETLISFIQGIFGIVAPFYNPPLTQSRRTSSQALFWRLRRDRSHAIEDLKDALTTVMYRMRSNSRRKELQHLFKLAKEEADRSFSTARKVKSKGWNTQGEIPFDNSNDIKRALAVLQLLSDHDESPRRSFQLWQARKRFKLCFLSDGSVPIGLFLSGRGVTHQQRVGLIVSFIKKLVRCSEFGVIVRDFRAASEPFSQLYRVVCSEKEIRFVFNDLKALSLDDGWQSGIINSQWLDGRILAKAIRFLYYGKTERRGITNAHLYRQPWNDNIVDDLASVLERRVFIEARDLMAMIQQIFRDEMTGWPIIISRVDSQFIRDTVDAEAESVGHVISQARPTHLIEDRGLYTESLVYALWEGAQLGLIDQYSTLALYRYTQYIRQRWFNAKERDFGMATAITTEPPTEPTFVCLADPDHSRHVCHEVFGLSYDSYLNWLRNLLDEAEAYHSKIVLPGILAAEKTLHEYRRRIVDDLRSALFTFSVLRQGEKTGEDQLTLKTKQGVRLARQLNDLGYKKKTWPSITLKTIDPATLGMDGSLRRIGEIDKDDQCEIDIALSPESEIVESGFFRLIDRGSEAVLNAEDTLFRYLKYSLSESAIYNPELPVSCAWRWLEQIVGRNRLESHVHGGLWSGEVRHVLRINHDDAADHIDKILRGIKDRSGFWQLITGAAGTGKTHITAELVMRYLDSVASEHFPVRRVLVVSASHFALDNFDNTLFRLSKGRYIPYRYVSQTRLNALREMGTLDESVLQRTRRYCDALTEDLPSRQSPSRQSQSLVAYRAKIERNIDRTDRALCQPDGRKKTFALISSHERWRSRHKPENSWQPADQLTTRLQYMKTQISRLDTYTDIDQLMDESEREGASAQGGLYEKFAAKIIETTIDSFDRLPDMWFDLVIVEEASQVSTLKLLQVLTKVIRARDDSRLPALVLSGDARQLPPFVGHARVDGSYRGIEPETVASMDPEIRNEIKAYRTAESPFARIHRLHRKRSLVLQVQRRMHSDIATLINSLFYSDQHWRTVKDDQGSGVIWYSTSALNAAVEQEPGGFSLYNLLEVRIVSALVRRLKQSIPSKAEKILIVSPYAAQVRKLSREFNHDDEIDVRTIDGCQGIESNTVIISLVSLSYSRDRDFVIEPRRLNVALSRARNSLYIVGDLQKAFEHTSRLTDRETYNHMVGLTQLFLPGGHFHDGLRNAADLLTDDSTRRH